MEVIITVLGYILRIIQVIYLIMGISIFSGVYNSKVRIIQIGSFLGGATFIVAAIFSYQYNSWWPILIGFLFAHLLRYLGLDPGH